MNKNILILTIGGTIVATSLYGYTINKAPESSQLEDPVIRELKPVKKVARNPLKNRGTDTCPKHKKTSLRLLHNGGKVWKKSHNELFQLEAAQTFDHRRLKGDKTVLPLEALYIYGENIHYIDFKTCNNKISTLSIKDINDSGEPHFLGLNKKGMLKLMRRDEKPRYTTVYKSIIEINLREE